jgi:hypothetical protein
VLFRPSFRPIPRSCIPRFPTTTYIPLAQYDHPTSLTCTRTLRPPGCYHDSDPYSALNNCAQPQILRSYHGRVRTRQARTAAELGPDGNAALDRLAGSAKRSEMLSGKSLVYETCTLLQLQYTHSSRVWLRQCIMFAFCFSRSCGP